MFRFHQVPALLPFLFPKVWWKRPVRDKTIFLTFDDGPIPEVTEFVLAQLHQYAAKATFFCVGENVERYRGIAQQIAAAGHVLANHTYHHVKAWQYAPETYLQEVAHCQEVLQTTIGSSKKPLFRPPHGQLTRAHLRMLIPTYQVVMWSSLTYDFDHTLLPEACLRKAISVIKPGSIVVMHDSLKAERNLRYVLPRLLRHFSDLGYSFQTL